MIIEKGENTMPPWSVPITHPVDSREQVFSIILKSAKTFKLVGSRINPIGTHWNAFDNGVLQVCIRHFGAAAEKKFQEVVIARINEIGRECFEQQKHTNIWPDHTSSPRALAYAIHFGELSVREVQSIKFDHGDTYLTFMREEYEELVDNVIWQLVRVRPVAKAA